MEGAAGSTYAGNPDWVIVLKLLPYVSSWEAGPRFNPPPPTASLPPAAQSSPIGAPSVASSNDFMEHLDFPCRKPGPGNAGKIQHHPSGVHSLEGEMSSESTTRMGA